MIKRSDDNRLRDWKTPKFISKMYFKDNIEWSKEVHPYEPASSEISRPILDPFYAGVTVQLQGAHEVLRDPLQLDDDLQNRIRYFYAIWEILSLGRTNSIGQ